MVKQKKAETTPIEKEAQPASAPQTVPVAEKESSGLKKSTIITGILLLGAAAVWGIVGYQAMRSENGQTLFGKYFHSSDDVVVATIDGENVYLSQIKEIADRIPQYAELPFDMIYPHLTPTFADKIHKIDLIENEYPFSVSERFIGKICDGRPESEYAVLYQNLTLIQQEKLACDLALFFHKLHQIDYKKLNIPEPTEAIDNWDVTTENNFDIGEVQKTLSRYKININDYMVKSPNIVTALCHNDLSGSNILLNTEKDDVLVGIIDFGNTIIMPKYQDFFPLYKIHRKLAIDTLKEYNKLTSSPIEQKQIDYLALLYTGWGLARTTNPSSPYFMKLLKPFLEE